MRVRRMGGFYPTQNSAVSGWLRLAASSQSGGEWTPSIVDVLNPGNPVTQTDVDRRAAVGAAANGLPTMVFDGTDVHVWPLSATINNMTTKLGFWFWFNPSTVSGVQAILGAGSLSTGKLLFYAVNAQVWCDCYISAGNGQTAKTGNILSAGTWISLYAQYDSSRGGNPNIAIYANGVSQSLSFTAIGAGGTLTTLPQPTGSFLLGGNTDSDTPSIPIANGGQIGPNIFAFNDNLTAAQIAQLLAFEVPT